MEEKTTEGRRENKYTNQSPRQCCYYVSQTYTNKKLQPKIPIILIFRFLNKNQIPLETCASTLYSTFDFWIFGIFFNMIQSTWQELEHEFSLQSRGPCIITEISVQMSTKKHPQPNPESQSGCTKITFATSIVSPGVILNITYVFIFLVSQVVRLYYTSMLFSL